MNISIKIDGTREVREAMEAFPKQAGRACEQALDYTAKFIQADVQKEMLSVFKSPVDYTIKSVKTTLTKGHNMQSSVWIATPKRMAESYMTPQVEGGSRKLKGFERGIDNQEFVPGAGAKLNAAGNIPVATIKAALDGSKKRRGDYVRITERRGKLLPGVYQRFKTSNGFNRKTHRAAGRLIQRGKMRGRFASAIVARGLKPIMIEGRTGHKVNPQLDFYGVAQRTFSREFDRKFSAAFNAAMRS